MEYEYSFNVENIDNYIEYCKNNNYELIEENSQKRTIYRNENGTIGRITIKNKKNIFLDFKEDKLTDDVLIKRRETPSIEINDLDSTKKILKFLGYKKDNVLERTRIIYKKGKVKFEIDSYKKPKVAYVVAIEGIKSETDKVYEEIIKLNNDER